MRRQLVLRLRHQAGASKASWQPEVGDAVVYAVSALFALIVATLSSIVLYRQWGQLAVGPYAGAAVISLLLARRARRKKRELAPVVSRGLRHWGRARLCLFLAVLVGATLLPLALEIAWRSDGNPSTHVQPEVTVVEQAALRFVKGEPIYHATVRDGHVISATPGEPPSDSFNPYLPLLPLFGLPSTTHAPPELTDARIFFTLVTLLVVLGALSMYRGPNDRKVRTLQVLAVLPTAALPLATGGDDMPIVAFLLLAMVLAERRKPGLAGFALGIASAMKFTAWPLAALALFAARDEAGRRAPGRMLLGMLVVVGPTVIPFLLHNPGVFVENVLLFPLGLAGVASPAASPLPGHMLVSAFPSLHRVIPAVGGALGGVVLVRHLMRHTPHTAAQVATLGGWVMTAAICIAPATRVGYLLYPINFFVWGHLLRGGEERAEEARGEEASEPLRSTLVPQVASGS